jgi:riboflavin synthase
MFTGLVETVGKLRAACQASPSAPRRLGIWSGDLACADVKVGDSIAIDGCCLTVVEIRPEPQELWFEATTETLQRTRLGSLRVGTPVNLERALRFGDRLGGHLVSGHVDGQGEISGLNQRDSALYMQVKAPADLQAYITPRGSITIDGVSLTVSGVQENHFEVALIPHTLANTTLCERQVGDQAHLEVDLLARYVDRLLQAGGRAGQVRP